MQKRFLQPSKPHMVNTSACAQAALVPRKFYLDPPDVVAQRLLGKLLVRPGETLVGRIVEVEAYFGESRPRVALLSRQDGQKRRALRTAGICLRLLHLRHAFLPECLLRTGGPCRRRAVPGAGAHLRPGGHGCRPWLGCSSPGRQNCHLDLRPRATVPGLWDHAGAGQRRRFYLAKIGSADPG